MAQYFDPAKNTMDPPLTQNGIAQAQLLGYRLMGLHFDQIYCSDLKRAVKTAEIINQQVNSHIFPTPVLREIDMGEIYRKPWSEYPDLYEAWKLHEQDIPYPGGENGQDVWLRVKPLLESIIRTDAKRVALVCHGGTIRCMICGLLGIPQQKRFLFGHPLENCSITTVSYSGGIFSLHSFNDSTHIKA